MLRLQVRAKSVGAERRRIELVSGAYYTLAGVLDDFSTKELTKFAMHDHNDAVVFQLGPLEAIRALVLILTIATRHIKWSLPKFNR